MRVYVRLKITDHTLCRLDIDTGYAQCQIPDEKKIMKEPLQKEIEPSEQWNSVLET